MTTHWGTSSQTLANGPRERSLFRSYVWPCTSCRPRSISASDGLKDRREASQPDQVPKEASGRPSKAGSTFIGAVENCWPGLCASLNTRGQCVVEARHGTCRNGSDPSERDFRPRGRDDGAGGRRRGHAGSAGIQPHRGRGGRSREAASRAERNGRANAPRAMSALRPEMWGRPEGSSRRHPCKVRAAGSASRARVRNRSPILHSRGGGGYLARTGRLRDCTGRNDRR
jgi:hypothetical protein